MKGRVLASAGWRWLANGLRIVKHGLMAPLTLTTRVVTVAASMVVFLAGCGGGRAVARSAVDDLAAAFGRTADDIVLSSTDLETLAQRADVPSSVIEQAAEGAGSSGLWARATSLVSRVDARTEHVLRYAVAQTACDAIVGQPVTRDSFLAHLSANVVGLTEDDLDGLVRDAQALAEDLTDPEQSADAVLFCFTVDQLLD